MTRWTGSGAEAPGSCTYYDGLVRAVRSCPTPTRRAAQLNVEETTLSTQFHYSPGGATAAAAVVVDDKAKLAGLDEGAINNAAAAAKDRKLDGKFLLPLQNTTQQPVLGSLSDRDQRAAVLKASETRAERGDANVNRQTVQRLAQLRAQKAKLLGFDTFADYQLGDQMAKTPAAALKLLTDTVPAATSKARAEAGEIQKVIDAQKGGFQVAASDWDFYAEQVRKAKYDLDESQIKPYFELDNVLQNGVFYAATQLYGITFKPRTDIPTYNPDMKVYEVFDKDGTSLALFYTDYFKRDSKSGGAWMDVFVEQDGLTGASRWSKRLQLHQAGRRPAALISFDDVTTMFHEFGHALHGMFSNVKYPSIAGTATSRDFVEFPSQFNEHWALDPKVFANYAKHYKTGEAMPQELVDKILKARSFNQGYATTEYLSAALLDLAWHTQKADAPLQDVGAFEASALKKFKVDLPQVPPRYRTTYFDHIWGGGYSAGYYAYFWATKCSTMTPTSGSRARWPDRGPTARSSATRSSRAATAWSCRPCTAISAARTRRGNAAEVPRVEVRKRKRRGQPRRFSFCSVEPCSTFFCRAEPRSADGSGRQPSMGSVLQTALRYPRAPGCLLGQAQVIQRDIRAST